MSGMYNRIFGNGPRGHCLVRVLGFNMIFDSGAGGHCLVKVLGFKELSDIGRYRDAWIERDEQGNVRIAVYTRNGGNNRAEYMPDFLGHPYYQSDRDDDFDSTYATVYFDIPTGDSIEEKALRKVIRDKGDDIQPAVDMSKRWQETIDNLKNR